MDEGLRTRWLAAVEPWFGKGVIVKVQPLYDEGSPLAAHWSGAPQEDGWVVLNSSYPYGEPNPEDLSKVALTLARHGFPVCDPPPMAPTFHTGGVVTDPTPVREPSCAVVPYAERQQQAEAWAVLQPQSVEGGPGIACDWSKVLERARRNPVPMPGGPGEPLTREQLREMASRPRGTGYIDNEGVDDHLHTPIPVSVQQLAVISWSPKELERMVDERAADLRRDFEGQLTEARDLLRQATQLLGDGEGGELQRQWLAEARRVLGGGG